MTGFFAPDRFDSDAYDGEVMGGASPSERVGFFYCVRVYASFRLSRELYGQCAPAGRVRAKAA